MKLGFIGLGVMGLGFVKYLTRKGYEVTAYDVKKEAIEEASKMGALAVLSPKEVAEASDVVLLSLPSPLEVEDVIFGQSGVAEAAKGVIIVNLSTIGPAASVKIEKRLKEHEDFRFLDIPVTFSGPLTPNAEESTLTLIASGDQRTLKEVEDILNTIGKETVYVGPIGAAQVVKLANNAIAAINTMGMVEVFAWATKQGVKPDILSAVLTKGSGDSWVLRTTLPRIMKGDFKPGFTVRLMHKDLGLFLKSATERSLFVPFTSLAYNVLQAMKGRGFGNNDNGIVAKFYEEISPVG